MNISIIHRKTNGISDTVLGALECQRKTKRHKPIEIKCVTATFRANSKNFNVGILIYLLESLLKKSTISFILIFIPHSYSINIYWLPSMYNRNLAGNQPYLVLTQRKDALKKSQKHGI